MIKFWLCPSDRIQRACVCFLPPDRADLCAREHASPVNQPCFTRKSAGLSTGNVTASQTRQKIKTAVLTLNWVSLLATRTKCGFQHCVPHNPKVNNILSVMLVAYAITQRSSYVQCPASTIHRNRYSSRSSWWISIIIGLIERADHCAQTSVFWARFANCTKSLFLFNVLFFLDHFVFIVLITPHKLCFCTYQLNEFKTLCKNRHSPPPS